MKRIAAVFGLWLVALAFAVAAAPVPRLEGLEQSLHLTPPQKAQYDMAMAATQRLLVSMALQGLQLKEKVKDEFSKTRPDLNALADAHDAIVEFTRAQHRAARDEWLKLYAMLNDDQVATVKSFLEEKVGQLEVLREAMRALILGQRPAN